MGDPRYRREAVRALEYMIPECRPDLNCIVHDADLPFPDYLKDINYHLIVLGPTFLCHRYHPSKLARVLVTYDFIKHSDACKVALPQDDYDCSGILDDWMVDWKIDRIYTVCADHWNVLYPKASQTTEIILGYTGYVSAKRISAWQSPKPHTQRQIDVSYRASKLSANFGGVGQVKWEIADRFKSAVSKHKELRLDISVDPKDLIPGDAWHAFVEDSKFVLTTPSGSSLLDPWNEIRKCVAEYTERNSNAPFQQIEKHCFPGQDRQYIFTALSPRNIEAALAQTIQIATTGCYSRLMNPVDHYIPLDEDCGNIDYVLEMMADESLVQKIKKQCKESILSEPRLRSKNIVDEIVAFAELIVSQRIVTANQERIERKFARYNSEIQKISESFWRRKRMNKKLKLVAAMLGAKRVKQLLLPILRRA